MAIFVFNLGAAVLAAMAVESLAFNAEGAWIDRIKRGALWFALLVFVLITLTRSAPGTFDVRSVVTALVAIMVAALLHGQSRGLVSPSTVVACLVALLVVELSYGPSNYLPHRSNKARNQNLPRMARDAELVKALRALPQPARAELNNDSIPHTFGDFHGIDVFHGYLASLTRSFYDLHPHDEKTEKLYGVRYKVAKEAQGGWNRLVYSSRQDWKIWENPEAFPRAFTIHKAVRIASREDIDRIYSSPQPNLRTETFLYTAPPNLETCDGEDQVWLLRRETDLVRIAVNMRCRGMVVLGDNNFPGWVASVDGSPAEIHDAYTALRGVVVDRGWHMVEMRYRPRSVYLGALLTLLGLITVALAAWFDRARPRAHKSRTFRAFFSPTAGQFRLG
jgi:hypothetical protein